MSVPTLAALVFTIISCRTGQEVGFEALVADLVKSDVVFLGEDHDNNVGHQLQLKIVKALHGRHRDLVISMEMFERDVQGILGDYVQGQIEEKTFLEHSRPWPNYKEHYRPIVEYAKKNNLDVIAANVPRKLARQITSGGLDAIDRESYVAKWVSTPRDRYYNLFKKRMGDHPGELSKETIERFYASQCVKDDTMAEAIHEFLRSHPHRQPLIVHLCGSFHSDYGLGTVSRLLSRDPLCRTSVVTMEPCEDPKKFKLEGPRDVAHYVLAVPAEPEEEEPDEKGKEGKEKPADPKAEDKPAEERKPVAKEAEKPEKAEEEEEGGRAALGLMPSYEERDEPGVVVDAVTPGKGAEKAGIKDGDVIMGLGGKKVVDLNDYMDLMTDFKPGQTIKVKILRDGKEKVLDVKLGAYGR